MAILYIVPASQSDPLQPKTKLSHADGRCWTNFVMSTDEYPQRN